MTATRQPSNPSITSGTFDKLAALISADAPQPPDFRAVLLTYLKTVKQAKKAPRSAEGRALLALEAGDEADVDRALDMLRRQPAAAAREAFRLACALLLRRSNRPDAVSRLFQPDALWTSGSHETRASAVAFVHAGGWSDWEADLMERIADEPGPLRRDALQARFAIVRRIGATPGDIRRLFGVFQRLGPVSSKFGRSMAEILWLADAKALIQPLFGCRPELIPKALTDPLVAGLLRRGAWHRVPAHLRARARVQAGRLQTLERDTEAFWARMGDPRLRIAVVGNSACDIGRGLGPEIDAHDVVIRFNNAPEDGRFAADYGVRCDAKAFAARELIAYGAASRVETVVSIQQTHFVRNDMALDATMRATAKRTVYTPQTMTTSLRRQLGSPPSTGLTFLGQLRRLRGSLAGVGCYGFSMVDQLRPETGSSHYFEQSAAGLAHVWTTERALLDQWLGHA